MIETEEQLNFIATLGHKQNDLWDADLVALEGGDLGVPFAYLMWVEGMSVTDVSVLRVGLVGNKQSWSKQIVSAVAQAGVYPDAVITVGMGTMLSLSETEEDAKTLLSINNGVRPTEIPGAPDYLISHLKTGKDSPDRVVGIEILDDGSTGTTMDSGFNNPILEPV